MVWLVEGQEAAHDRTSPHSGSRAVARHGSPWGLRVQSVHRDLRAVLRLLRLSVLWLPVLPVPSPVLLWAAIPAVLCAAAREPAECLPKHAAGRTAPAAIRPRGLSARRRG